MNEKEIVPVLMLPNEKGEMQVKAIGSEGIAQYFQSKEKGIEIKFMQWASI